MIGDIDAVAVTRHRFIHRVVHNLPDKVVEACRTGRPDVHTGAFPYGLEPLQYLDVIRLHRNRQRRSQEMELSEELVGHRPCRRRWRRPQQPSEAAITTGC